MGSSNETLLKQSSKRKRRISHDETSLSAQKKGIKPCNSWSIGRQRQLSLAGITDDDEDPSQDIKYFPHRGIQHEELQFTSSDEGNDLDESKGLRPSSISSKKAKATHRGNHLDILLRSTHQLLDEGKVSKSAKLFGIILQLRFDGRPVDIRQHNLWALGAEIVMRTGEEENLARLGLQSKPFEHSGSYTHIRIPTRWGSKTNISRLRAYMDELIQKYPYDRRFPNTVSAMDFQLALLACEVYNCYAEFTAEISCLGEGQESCRPEAISRGQTSGNSLGIDYERDKLTAPEALLAQKVKRVTEEACSRIKDIASKIDAMMDSPPYSGNKYFIHLQGTVSLMMADLLASSAHNDDDDDDSIESRDGIKAAKTQRKANILFQRLRHHTKHSVASLLDVSVQRICQNPQPQQSRFHVSLPIRGT
ncbi:hypothetical protein E4U21_004851 [Claviceps maximensis]|nr:hypothetical protein E4U21_004851 [Claviceps maximensis]